MSSAGRSRHDWWLDRRRPPQSPLTKSKGKGLVMAARSSLPRTRGRTVTQISFSPFLYEDGWKVFNFRVIPPWAPTRAFPLDPGGGSGSAI